MMIVPSQRAGITRFMTRTSEYATYVRPRLPTCSGHLVPAVGDCFPPAADFRTNFWRQPPEGLTSHPPVSPPKMLPHSSAASPSGRVPSMKYLIEPSLALPIRIPFFHPGFRMALPPPSGASFAPPILWLDSESDTINVSSFRIQTLLGRPKWRHSSTMFMFLSKTWIRLFDRSATKSRPFESNARPCGPMTAPGFLRCVPNALMNLPSVLYQTSRSPSCGPDVGRGQ